jgi:hypothetical protein
LGVTANNASNNDLMIEHLADRLEDFPGASNQTRCFLHILSITAKAIIKQFDVPKTKNDSAVDEVAQALARLAEGIDIEEQDAWGTEECGDDEVDDQPLDRWLDLHDGLTDEELGEIEEGIQPVRTTLTKVRVTVVSGRVDVDFRLAKLRKFAYAVKKSTTILLPQWYKALDSCDLPHRMMPRDVSTRWNSTYDMLSFTLEFHVVIDSMTAMHNLDLRKYELSSAEWDIAKELSDVLKVFSLLTLNFNSLLLNALLSDIQGRNIVLFSRHPQPCHGYPSNGPY